MPTPKKGPKLGGSPQHQKQLMANLAASLTNQNFLALPSITPTLATSFSGTNLSFNWSGISGVTYQLQYSTDLLNWTNLSVAPLGGSGGPVQFIQPLGTDAAGFFRLLTAH